MSQTTVAEKTAVPPPKTKEMASKISSERHRGRFPEYFTCALYESKVHTLLSELNLASCHPNTKAEDFLSTDSASEPNTEEPASPKKHHVISDKMACTTCDCQFTTRSEQRKHYKLDWHRFNLKHRTAGLPSVTEENFEGMSAGDISSISGSDSDSSESESEENEDLSPISKPHKIQASYPTRLKSANSGTDSETDDDSKFKNPRGRQYPKMYFKNGNGQILSIYRCIVYGKHNVPVTQNELIYKTQNLTQQLKWCVLMVAGGHFAGAIFDGDKVMFHKTFHRYTVRAKRGSAQGIRDGQQGGNAPRSAGASLRRYNEAALVQDIHDLLDDWKEHLANCDRIFLRAPSYNRAIFLSGKNAHFSKKDRRLVTIPFSTRRPTFAEVKRVHAELVTVECYGDEEDVVDLLPWSPKPKVIPRRLSKQKGGGGSDEPSDQSHEEKPKPNPNQQRSENNTVQATDGMDESLVVKSLNVEGTLRKDSRDGVPTVEVTNYDVSSEKWKESAPQNESGDKDESDAEYSLSLEIAETMSSTLHLREFETTRRKPRRKKKTVTKEREPTTEVEEKNRPGSALYQLRNDLYTACKTGDDDMLQALLSNLSQTETVGPHVTGLGDAIIVHESSGAAICDELPANDENVGTRVRTDNTESASGDLPAASEFMDLSAVNLQPEKSSQSSDRIQATDQTLEGSKVNPTNAPTTPPSMNKTEILNDSFADDGRTLLHIAAKAGQRKIIRLLLEAGADPTLRDKNGKTSYIMANDKPTRKEFRKFMADFPDVYDYSKAQIPSPLTTEMETEKASKQAEKKKEKKKARKEKQKEQKAEDKKRKDEEKEKQWFTSLSDREKRALAAERRLAQQLDDKSIKRCWSCGESLAEKVPFEYMDFKFCSVKCLKRHRQQQQEQSAQKR